MAEAAFASRGHAEIFGFLQLNAKRRLKKKLGDAISPADTPFLVRGIEQNHGDFTAIVGVNNAHALSHDKPLQGAKAAP